MPLSTRRGRWYHIYIPYALLTVAFIIAFAVYRDDSASKDNNLCKQSVDNRVAVRDLDKTLFAPIPATPNATPDQIVQLERANEFLAQRRNSFLKKYPIFKC